MSFLYRHTIFTFKVRKIFRAHQWICWLQSTRPYHLGLSRDWKRTAGLCGPKVWGYQDEVCNFGVHIYSGLFAANFGNLSLFWNVTSGHNVAWKFALFSFMEFYGHLFVNFRWEWRYVCYFFFLFFAYSKYIEYGKSFRGRCLQVSTDRNWWKIYYII